MSLMRCPDCNSGVSTEARVCPNCGRPIRIDEVGPLFSKRCFEDDKIKFLTSYAEDKKRSWELVGSINRSNASRLVWFVAISGYVVINLKPFTEAIIDHSLQGWRFLFLVVPWIATAISALLTETLLSIQTTRDSLYYTASLARINAFIVTKADRATQEEFSTLFSEDDETKKLKRRVEKMASWVRRMEHATFILLVMSFIWVLIGPFCLK